MRRARDIHARNFGEFGKKLWGGSNRPLGLVNVTITRSRYHWNIWPDGFNQRFSEPYLWWTRSLVPNPIHVVIIRKYLYFLQRILRCRRSRTNYLCFTRSAHFRHTYSHFQLHFLFVRTFDSLCFYFHLVFCVYHNSLSNSDFFRSGY